jgi:radical SAM superfamily enzyme YgiQ (UPF0313 family)
MRVLLISANTERINLPTLPVGLALVATAAREAGHEAVLLDLMTAPDPGAALGRAIQEHSPDVIGISVRNVDDQCMESPRFLLPQVSGVVAACRACSAAPLVLGGAGYSIFPAAALSYLGADLGVAGEGEVVFPQLLSLLERREDPGDLPGVYVRGRRASGKRTFAPNLDILPYPGEDLWASANPRDPDLWVPVQSRRGCSLDCSYCSTAGIEGRTIRARLPSLVAADVARIAQAGFQRVYFVDNTFNLPPSYALELCRQIAAQRLEIAWRCILYPHDVSVGLVRAMAEAGCAEASLGFESGSERILRAMNKRFLPDEVRRISDLLAAHGIRRMGFLLLGGPGETQASVDESLAFADSLHLDGLKVTVGIRIYPDTALAETALREGLIAPDDDLLFPRFYLTPGLEIPHPQPTPGGP